MNVELLKKAHERVPSVPVLVNLISKREKQLINGEKPLVRPLSSDEDKVDTALREVAEGKLNEQLAKVGITSGKMSFTFNSDSTFVTKVNKKTVRGTYSYTAGSDNIQLKFGKLIPMNVKVNCTSSQMDLLFNADKLMNVLTLIASKSKNTTLKTIGTLAENYDGMLLGFSMQKQQ